MTEFAIKGCLEMLPEAQTQILDFLGKVTLRHTKKSLLIRGRSKKMKKNVRMKKILSEIASGVQKTLDMFTSVLGKVKERVSKYVPSFKTPKASPYTGDKLTEIEKISYQCKTTYRGDIRHLFLFYPFDERLDAWERENHPQNKGSSNENPLYRVAIDEFCEVYGFYPKTISVDRGMDSAANNEYSIRKGIYAYIQARDFGNRELVKTEKGKCFRPEYISVNEPSFLERIADRRSECERSFCRDKCGYRRDEMSNRGAIEAELYMFITGITTHLTAITAYHVGRTDLMRSPTAFRRMSLD